jgi:hypothetical protein
VKLKTKIGIMLFIIILLVGLYIGSQVKREANKIKLRIQEMLPGKLTVNQIHAQVYENQSHLCVPNLNSNKSNDLLCEQSTMSNITLPTLPGSF